MRKITTLTLLLIVSCNVGYAADQQISEFRHFVSPVGWGESANPNAVYVGDINKLMTTIFPGYLDIVGVHFSPQPTGLSTIFSLTWIYYG